MIVPRVDHDALRVVAERVLEAGQAIEIATPRAIDGPFLKVSLSIGGGIYPDDAGEATALIEKADIALYRSKSAGRGRATLYEARLGGPASASEALAAAEERVRERELDFRAVFAAAHDPFLILDDAAKIVDANPAASELAGLPIEELCERSIFDFVADTREQALARIVRDAAGSDRQAGEYEIVLPDGSRRAIEYNVAAFSPGRHLLVIRDITEQRAALDQIAESEHKFRSLFENAGDAIVITDDDVVIVDANAAAERLAGMSREQLIGTSAQDVIPAEDRSQLVDVRDEVLAGEEQRGVFEGTWPDGRQRAVEFSTIPNFLPGRHLSIVRDVTARVGALRAVAESEAVYRAVITSIDEGILLVDPSGTVRSGNPAAAEILGIAEERLAGGNVFDPIWDIVDAAGRRISAEDHPAITALRAGRELSGETLRVRRLDGSEVWISANAELLAPTGKTGDPLLVVSFSAAAEPEAAAEAAPGDRRRPSPLTSTPHRQP